ncbi:type III polyketide synthase [Sabulicella glaciei]|uniref:Type III polyketide synthase n=1 Tax=Sabulicella glaciei TaxID=2984948 RepID=A0ABT3P1X0_9PROT|nr:type III polyketide synthase [Roseococcus sp. MDT2-1-1]MCW8088381.1 type III polyketide synthase [Roseococcus sp. MDT2-1-1]
MPPVFLNAIGTATPPHDVHERFLAHAPTLLRTERERQLFVRMAERSGIAHRWSFLRGELSDRFYIPGRFPTTAERMARYRQDSLPLAEAALEALGERLGRDWRQGVTHLLLVSCTGFEAPGLDQRLIAQCGLDPEVERSVLGFMGCNAAFHALKLARHIVRSEPASRVLVLNLELCTLHFQETDSLAQALCFMLFSDGCSASLVSAEPRGLELERFSQVTLPDSMDLITWHIGDDGFDMGLSGQVPGTILSHLPDHLAALLGQARQEEFPLWAVHPGGRSILDAVQLSLGLRDASLAASRVVLHDFGNMSSATVMFVLARMMEEAGQGRRGVGLGFGPGVGVESLLFREAA